MTNTLTVDVSTVQRRATLQACITGLIGLLVDLLSFEKLVVPVTRLWEILCYQVINCLPELKKRSLCCINQMVTRCNPPVVKFGLLQKALNVVVSSSSGVFRCKEVDDELSKTIDFLMKTPIGHDHKRFMYSIVHTMQEVLACTQSIKLKFVLFDCLISAIQQEDSTVSESGLEHILLQLTPLLGSPQLSKKLILCFDAAIKHNELVKISSPTSTPTSRPSRRQSVSLLSPSRRKRLKILCTPVRTSYTPSQEGPKTWTQYAFRSRLLKTIFQTFMSVPSVAWKNPQEHIIESLIVLRTALNVFILNSTSVPFTFVVNKLRSMVSGFVKEESKGDMKIKQTCYLLLLNCIADLFCADVDFLEYFQADTEVLFQFLRLPWNTRAWAEESFTIPSFSQPNLVGTAAGSPIDITQIRCLSLQLIAILPLQDDENQDGARKRRRLEGGSSQEMNSKTALMIQHLSDKQPHIRATVAAVIPFLIALSPSSRMQYFRKLRTLIKDPEPVVANAVAVSIGYLACSRTGHLKFSRTGTGKISRRLPWLTLKLEFLSCSLCNPQSAGSTRADSSSAGSFKDFHQLFNHPSSTVRASFITSVCRIIRHSKVADERYFEAFVCSDAEIRRVARGIIQAAPCNIVLMWIKRQLEQAQVSFEIQESLMTYLADLAAQRDECQEEVLLLLVQYLADPNFHVRGVSLLLIRKIAHSCGCTVKQLVTKHRRAIYSLVMKRLLDSKLLLNEVALSLFDISPKQWLTRMLPHQLPTLVFQRSEILINEVADELGVSCLSMLLDNMQYILAYILRQPTKEVALVLPFLCNLVKEAKLQSLVRTCYCELVNELVRALGETSSHKAILRTLCYIAACVERSTALQLHEVRYHQSKLANFIGSNFLGIMDFVREVLVSKHEDDKRCILQSLKVLIPLLGTHIQALHPKVITTLQLVQHNSNLHGLGCDVWFTLVNNLPTKEIGPVLSQIVVSLLPYLGTVPAEAKRILEFLIVSKEKQLSPYFKTISFLPDRPELQKLRQRVLAHCPSASTLQHLETLVRGIQYENENVREIMLAEVNLLLSDHFEDLSALISESNGNALRIYSSLIKSLLVGCREHPDRSRRLLFSECLGKAGAVDPAFMDDMHLRVELPKTKEDTALAKELIEDHFIKAYTAARDVKSQDFAAISIQKLLKFLQCTKETVDMNGLKATRTADMDASQRRGLAAWKKFSPEVQKLIKPLLSSDYEVIGASSCSFQVPIFKSGMTFRAWIQRWTQHLTNQEKQDDSQSMLSACLIMANADMELACLLMPYVVLNIIRYGDAGARRDIQAEILAVLRNSSSVALNSDNESRMHVQLVFRIMDMLSQWVREHAPIKQVRSRTRRLSRSSNRKDHRSTDPTLELVAQLIKHDIPNLDIAKAAFTCKAYTRALLHYELFLREEIKSDPENTISIMETNWAFLRDVYQGIDEPDGLAGIATLRKKPSIVDRAQEYETSGNWMKALTCYEQGLQQTHVSSNQIGMLRCLHNLGHFELICKLAEGELVDCNNEDEGHLKDVNTLGIRAAWRLRDWSRVSKFLEYPFKPDFEVSVAQSLLYRHQKNMEGSLATLKEERQHILEPLSAASMESYQAAYPFIMRLAMLNEIEESCSVGLSKLDADRVTSRWNAQDSVTHPSYKMIEPMLHLRAVQFEELQMTDRSKDAWITLARHARKAGYFRVAANALHRIQSTDPQITLEYAKLLWAQGEQHKALRALLDEVQLRDTKSGQSQQTSLVVAKMNLLSVKWTVETGQEDSASVLNRFKNVVNMQNHWENGYFALANYCDMLYKQQQADRQRQQNLRERRGRTHKGNDIRFIDKAKSITSTQVIVYYGKALEYGSRYVFQSLPRLLTLWFESSSQSAKKHSNTLHMLQDRMPMHLWLLCFSQLISRICHNNKEVFATLSKIINKVLTAFPQQAFWSLVALTTSTYKIRRERAVAIMNQGKVSSLRVRDILEQGSTLSNHLLNLANAPPETKSINIRRDFSSLKRMMPLTVAVPHQQTFHTLFQHGPHQETKAFDPFPEELITIANIEDEVEIMSSLQKPKKITFIGSNARSYVFLCKPKDDLRKDKRLMEFNSMINTLLKKNPSSRRRNLQIRTYAVTPLNEECGLIEWVQHTTGLRHILQPLYQELHSKNTVTARAKELYQNPSLTAIQRFNKLLSEYPPVFYHWFLRK